MPPRRHARHGELSFSLRLQLGHGAEDGPDTLDAEALAALWATFRGELLDEWMWEHPGSRPWAYWALDLDREPPDALDGLRYLIAADELAALEVDRIRRRASAAAARDEPDLRDRRAMELGEAMEAELAQRNGSGPVKP